MTVITMAFLKKMLKLLINDGLEARCISNSIYICGYVYGIRFKKQSFNTKSFEVRHTLVSVYYYLVFNLTFSFEAEKVFDRVYFFEISIIFKIEVCNFSCALAQGKSKY